MGEEVFQWNHQEEANRWFLVGPRGIYAEIFPEAGGLWYNTILYVDGNSWGMGDLMKLVPHHINDENIESVKDAVLAAVEQLGERVTPR